MKNQEKLRINSLSKEEFQEQLQEQLETTAKMVATTIYTQESIVGSPIWNKMLEAVKEFKRNGYKIVYHAPNEIIPELDEIAEKLIEGETESIVIILSDARLIKLPTLNCHHYHLIELLSDYPELKITYIEL